MFREFSSVTYYNACKDHVRVCSPLHDPFDAERKWSTRSSGVERSSSVDYLEPRPEMPGDKDIDQNHFFRRIRVLLQRTPTVQETLEQTVEDLQNTRESTPDILVEPPVCLFPMASTWSGTY